ncbi:MAG TPA: DUF6114 domain-containing protein [Thermoplasmataceae archaeon]|nr:DUF6114 domain-containing protein [Thermoplasmataceae archaeon]
MDLDKFFRTPIDSSIVSLIAGSIFLYIGISVRLILGQTGGSFMQSVEADLGILWGALTVVSGILLLLNWKNHSLYGSIILISSMLSWIGDNGGFLVGFVLGLLGGIMSITWNPVKYRKGTSSR